MAGVGPLMHSAGTVGPLSSPAPAAAGTRALPSAVGLLVIGLLALAAGLLVYAADRDPARAMLFPSLAALQYGPVFGANGSWLPSFVHPFAFSLFTAAAMRPRARPAYGACAAWWGVNVAFETAQHSQVSGALADSLQRLLGHNAVTDALAAYILRGNFDRADLVAASAGALAAAALLAFLAREGNRHAQ